MSIMQLPLDVLGVDKVFKDYLSQNLEKVQQEIKELQAQADLSAEQSDALLKEVADIRSGIDVVLVGTKTFRGKYVSWFHVQNYTGCPMENIHFLLHWNSHTEFTYVTSMHHHVSMDQILNLPFYHFKGMVKEASFAVVYSRPEFTKELSVEINGCVSCKAPGKYYSLEVPQVLVGTEDMQEYHSNLELIQKDGNVMDFHSRLLCSWKVDFFLLFKKDKIFKDALIRTGLTPLAPHEVPKEKIPQRFYTIFDVSPLFDGTIVEISEARAFMYDISIYTKDETTLVPFVHHFYQKMEAEMLLPAEYKIRFPFSFNTGKYSEVVESMRKEITLLKYLAKRTDICLEEYQKLRGDLNELEHNSDKAYLAHLVASDETVVLISDEEVVEENKEVAVPKQ